MRRECTRGPDGWSVSLRETSVEQAQTLSKLESVIREYRKPCELGGRVLIAFRVAQSRARIKISLIDRPAQPIGGAGT